tara:strand:- start:13284 stop:13727 length:444 start_codon:yes stop_codon:yes gene_type:complete
VALIAVVAVMAFACGSETETASSVEQPASPPVPARPDTPVPVQSSENVSETGNGGTPVAVALQDVGGSGEYVYAPNEFAFSVGETVTFTFTSETEFHTFTVDDLEIDVSVDAESSEKFTFTFDKPGTYDIICIPHETQGMLGTITVQ